MSYFVCSKITLAFCPLETLIFSKVSHVHMVMLVIRCLMIGSFNKSLMWDMQ